MPEYNLFNLGLTESSMKKKQHAKVFGMDGTITSILRLNLNFPNIRFDINWTMILTTLIDLFFNLVFALEIELPEWELPFLEIVSPEIDFTKPQTPEQIIEPELLPAYQESKIEKAYYGITKYEYSYYDPIFTVRHVATEVKHGLVKQSKEYTIDDILRGVEVTPRLADFMHYVIRIGQDMIEQNFILGVNILSYSKLRMPASDNIKVQYTWHEAGYPIITYNWLDQLMWGFILGISPLSISRLAPKDRSVVKPEYRRLPAMRGRRVQNDFTPIRHARKIGETGIGALNVFKSKKAERYGFTRSLVRQIRRNVKNMLRNLVDNPFDLNKYQNAGVELALAYYKRNEKFTKKVKDVDISYLKKYWLSKWASWGLSLNLLERIYSMVESICLSVKDMKKILT